MSFKKGKSWNGNEQGRPPNSGHRQKLFNALVEPHRDKLFDKAINLALDGNEAMLRLLLDRMLPAKPTDDALSVAVPITASTKVETLVFMGQTILQSVSQGELTPDQGTSIMSLIDMQCKNIVTCELEKRLISIERTLKHRKQEK